MDSISPWARTENDMEIIHTTKRALKDDPVFRCQQTAIVIDFASGLAEITVTLETHKGEKMDCVTSADIKSLPVDFIRTAIDELTARGGHLTCEFSETNGARGETYANQSVPALGC